MAEIHIKPKTKRAVWPWILVILAVVAFLIWFFLRNRDAQPAVQSQLLENSPTWVGEADQAYDPWVMETPPLRYRTCLLVEPTGWEPEKVRLITL